jgi:GntR family transcriptional regulator
MALILDISEADPRPIYRQITDEIRRGLVVGSLKPDEALPSIRQLAVELRVNPNTVKQAYNELEREGLVYVRRGQGTFVGTPPDDGKDRRRFAREVAQRALRDAWRHGVSAGELVDAVVDEDRRGGGRGRRPGGKG